MHRTLRLSVLTLALAALAAGCGDTLLDHRASAALLAPACAANQVACDGACLTCNTPPNAVPACVAGGCGFTCQGGFNACGGSSCVAESAASCGPSCQDCTAGVPLHATGSCSAAHACEVACNPGWMRSGGVCVQATAVSSGYDHVCALLADQTVKCWGANERGEVGDGSTTDSPTPVHVALPAGVTAIAAGYNHSCALVGSSVFCWGDNTFGQVGNGSGNLLEPTPVEVPGITTAVAIGAGNTGRTSSPYGHTCAVLADGTLRCWGANTAGQLGDGSLTERTTPVAVTILPAGTQVAEVVGGERHTCVRTPFTPPATGGAVYCWGANDVGQLGIGTLLPQGSPAVATVASGATAIAAGEQHSCAIVTGVGLRCWGLNLNGQVDATTVGTSYSAPRAPGGLGGNFQPVILAAGRAHSCASKAADLPKCFGDNTWGQVGTLGNPSDAPVTDPVSALTAGSDHTCALTTALGVTGVQCWGKNTLGQLGRGTTSLTPERAGAYVSGR